MKVLHVIPSVSAVHGGPSRAIATIEAALASAGVAITTVTTDDDGPGRRLAGDAQPATANGADRVYARKQLEFYKLAPAIVPWLWRNMRKFDIVHIHALFSFTSLCAGRIARMHRVPYVVRPLGTLSAYGVTRRRPWLKRGSLALLERPLLRRAAAVHFTSDAEQEEARALGVRCNGAVVPLAVEGLDALAALPVRCERRPRRSSPLILFLSRLDPKKNLESLLQAYADLLHTHPNARLAIAGDGLPAYVASLHQLAGRLGIDRGVTWHGHVDGAEKTALFASADMFVLPSFSENFGIAAAEALAAGVPCILSQGVAIAEPAARAGGALVVAPEAEAVRQALMRLLDDADLRRLMAVRARSHAEELYSATTMARRLIALYTAILADGKIAA